MRVVFRTDASFEIGSGHVMRCLALSEALKNQGAEVEFICRKHQGNLINLISSQGFSVHALPVKNNLNQVNKDKKKLLNHAEWLGASQQEDSEQCYSILERINPDWVIVDHYAIDKAWHKSLKPVYRKLMVIDDLADRRHSCDILLDQTYGRKTIDYEHLIPEKCRTLLGSHYALLRPEFARWRKYSLQRRSGTELKQLIITMGGVDIGNYTCKILKMISAINLPKDMVIIVVMGETSPHRSEVESMAKTMSYSTKIKVNVNNMAELMAKSDLAIGAAGSTTWERCCLGLPSIQMVIADNQKKIAELLEKAGVIKLLSDVQMLPEVLNPPLAWMPRLSLMARQVCDGNGVNRVLEALLES